MSTSSSTDDSDELTLIRLGILEDCVFCMASRQSEPVQSTLLERTLLSSPSVDVLVRRARSEREAA